jgi:hypothetical protein
LTQPDKSRIDAGLELAAQSSWESIVGKMRSLIADAIQEFPIPDELDTTIETRNSASAEI